MSNVVSVVIKLMIGSTPVEFEMNAEGGVSLNDVKDFIDGALANGFTVPRQWQSQADIIGKKGTVTKIIPVENSKMFTVRADLDDGGVFEWKEFSATAFRTHDRIEVSKNDRGFKVGKLIDEMPEQNKLPF